MKKSFKFLAAIFTMVLTIFIANSVEASAGVGTVAAVGGLLEGPSKVRSIYKSLKNLDLGGSSIMEAFIRQEVVLKDTQSVYDFDFRSTGRGAYNTEPQIELLDRNDVFVATHVFIGTYEADTTKPGKVLVPIQTSCVPVADYWTTGTLFAPNDIYQVYNGKLIYKSSNKEELEAMNLRAHYFSHEKQGDLATGVTQGVNPEDGMQDFAVFPFIQGDSDTSFKMDLPIFDGIKWEHDAANKQVRVVMELHGVIVKNVSKDATTLNKIVESAAAWQ